MTANNIISRVDSLGLKASEESVSDPYEWDMGKMLDIIITNKKARAAVRNGMAASDTIDAGKELGTLAGHFVNIIKSRDEAALKEIIKEYGEDAIKAALKKAGVANVYVTGITGGADLGSALGNYIGDQMTNIYANSGMRECLCVALADASMADGQFTATPETGTVFTCYKSKSRIFVKVTSFEMSDSGFVGDLLRFFDKPSYVWYTNANGQLN